MRYTIITLLLTLACAQPKPVVTLTSPLAPTNYAYQAARANFPTGDWLAMGDRTALVRDGAQLAMCVEIDAQHHTKCLLLADFAPKQDQAAEAKADLPKDTKASDKKDSKAPAQPPTPPKK